MGYNPDIHHRKSYRLMDYDYSKPGLYFITICTYKKEHIFGEIENSKMIINKYGEIVIDEWIRTPEIRQNIKLDEFGVMPNHIHGIIQIVDDSVGAYCNTPLPDKLSPSMDCNTPLQNNQQQPNVCNTPLLNKQILGDNESKLKSPSKTVGAIIRGFKSAVSKKINEIRNSPGIPVWQRNFHDHIIRNEKEFYRIKTYIRDNPLKWDDDRYYQ
ncbi:MAG: hypothetical protein D8M58_15820 [Calditrichaeota bacterium]|nr:MAG: hypothetical protein DWQ03_07550 [Calditrichota bacterium]MBL1206873.1 hypothetical protein [Calditrichota bacterium]NOG46700.1 hypothetical protein [Calditrichota bacterium]